MHDALVVDDEPLIARSVANALRRRGVDAAACTDPASALRTLNAAGRAPRIVFLDLKMKPLTGYDLLERAPILDEVDHRVVLTGRGPDAVQRAFALGATAALSKPLGPTRLENFLDELGIVGAQAPTDFRTWRRTHFPGVVGESAPLLDALRICREVAATDASVLILGETGTGKEAIAAGIHAASDRASAPFVAVNCASIPKTLSESAFFGHEKGSFTGAQTSAEGYLAQAAGGTLFLDELGEMPLEIQGKLLRVLESGAYQPVGGTAARQADVRIVAATNRVPEEAVRSGLLRLDLLHRLNTVCVPLAPLRERATDISMLAVHFAARAAERFQRPRPELTPSLLEQLERHIWPGNIRELKHVIDNLVLLGPASTGRLGASGGLQAARSLHPKNTLPREDGISIADHLLRVERELIQRALVEAEGNKAEAARRLGMKRTTFLARLAKLRP